jgi:hypothetical protein
VDYRIKFVWQVLPGKTPGFAKITIDSDEMPIFNKIRKALPENSPLSAVFADLLTGHAKGH